MTDSNLDLDHRHDASIDDVLAFVNTLEFSDEGSREDLGTTAALLAWLRDRGLIHPETEHAAAHRFLNDDRDAAGLLDRAYGLRTAFRRVIEAFDEGAPAPQPALDTINEVLRHAYAYELVPSDTGVALGHRHPANDPGGGLASLAGALVDAVAEGHTDRLKACENDECRWVFRDASPAGRRRWCDMASCGNRAKARRHRERARRRAAPPPAS